MAATSITSCRILSLTVLAFAACSGNADLGHDNTTTVGGSTLSGGASTGGSLASTGGSPMTGGATASGGVESTGGSVAATGGSRAAGGTRATTGGTNTETGGTPAAGGNPSTGGNVATGGNTAAGNCGILTCNPNTEYCHETSGGAVGNPNSYSCVPLPSSCGSAPTCACVSGTACSANCTQAGSGLVTTVCLVPGGLGGASSTGGSTSSGGTTSAAGATSTDPVAQSCIDSGGTVTTSLCCTSLTADFPNNCNVGACGCSPDNSKTVRVCRCPSLMCFNGQACVSS